MNLKIKMRRINRGVVLGMIVILAVAIYVIISNIRFKNSADTIKDNASAFLEDYMKAFESDVQGIWSDKDKEEQKKKLKDVIYKYYTDKTVRSTNYYGENINDIVKCVDNAFFITCVGNIKDTSVKVTNAKISRYGSNGARYSATLKLERTVPCNLDYPYFGVFNEYTKIYANDKKIEEKYYTENSEFEVEGIFLYDDGDWKISSIDMFNTTEATRELDDESIIYDIETGKVIDKNVSDKNADETVDKNADQNADETVDKNVDKNADETVDKNVDKNGGQ